MMIALPPLLVPSTSAACLYNSLYLHPFCARIWKALNTLIAAAPFALALSETDAAISNHRLGAAQLAAALPNPIGFAAFTRHSWLRGRSQT